MVNCVYDVPASPAEDWIFLRVGVLVPIEWAQGQGSLDAVNWYDDSSEKEHPKDKGVNTALLNIKGADERYVRAQIG